MLADIWVDKDYQIVSENQGLNNRSDKPRFVLHGRTRFRDENNKTFCWLFFLVKIIF